MSGLRVHQQCLSFAQGCHALETVSDLVVRAALGTQAVESITPPMATVTSTTGAIVRGTDRRRDTRNPLRPRFNSQRCAADNALAEARQLVERLFGERPDYQ